MRVVMWTMGALMALGTTAGAQTVPAEEWVGAPMPLTGGVLTRAQVRAELHAMQRRPQAAAEAWVGPAADAQPQVGGLRRSEVRADLALAQRAGLLAAQAREDHDPASPDAMARQAYYRQLRDGVAFTRELDRIEGRQPDQLAGEGAGD